MCPPSPPHHPSAAATACVQVVHQFKAGEVDELLDPNGPRGRAVVHSGPLLKATKLGKRTRHYFLFSDGYILTAEGGPPMGSGGGGGKSKGRSMFASLTSSSKSAKEASDNKSSGAAGLTLSSGSTAGGASGKGGGGDGALKKCKWISLQGAAVHAPPLSSDQGYFMIVYPGDKSDKTSHLTAESSGHRDRWVRRLLQVLQKVSFSAPPLLTTP